MKKVTSTLFRPWAAVLALACTACAAPSSDSWCTEWRHEPRIKGDQVHFEPTLCRAWTFSRGPADGSWQE